jgi:hypothetical protein
LWDARGDDRYRAVRYAQGNGVHQAVGLLRDEAGNDHYELAHGVGQGMGLDLAVGALVDGAGNDFYMAQFLAQGTATANGLGLLVDAGGVNEMRIGEEHRAWGRAEWLRGLPSLGVLLYDPARTSFVRGDGAVMPVPRAAQLGGPFGGFAPTHEPLAERHCASVAPAAAGGDVALAEGLRRLAPSFYGAPVDAALYAEVLYRLITGVEASLAQLPRDDFEVLWSFGEALRCALAVAAPPEAAAVWSGLARVLARDPATPFASVIAGALRDSLPPAPQLRAIVPLLESHPRCMVRAAVVSARSALPAARKALRDPCWVLQAAALDAHKRLGAAPARGVRLPSFLRPSP